MDKKSGYIYITEDKYGVYYVGRTTRVPEERIKDANHPMKRRNPKIVCKEPYYNLTETEANKEEQKVKDKLKKKGKKLLINLNSFPSPTRKVKIYTYKFGDKVYVGFTSRSLEDRHQEHKRYSISSIYNYLNDEKTKETYPKHEETVTVDIYSDEIYEIYKRQRKILDKYTNKTCDILNKNLKLLGY